MATLVDSIRIEGTVHDRRRKLTPAQYAEINALRGVLSARKTAAQFNVSKRTIEFIWRPELREANVELRRLRGTQYNTREELTEASRSVRQYKRELLAEGKVVLKKKEKK